MMTRFGTEEASTAGGSLKPNAFYEMEGDHVQRYVWASQFVRGLSVIDDGCGYGYGTNYLASEGAHSLVGIDNDRRAIRYALQTYRRDNLAFVLGDGSNTGFRDRCFDTAVTFEVVEHVADVDKYLNEIRRLLRPGGLLVISTPNKKRNELSYIAGRPFNPYHLREFYPNEMKRILERYFAVKEMYGQCHVGDLTDHALHEHIRFERYDASSRVPAAVTKIVPDVFKKMWLRMNRIPTIDYRGKWRDFTIEKISSIDQLDLRFRKQLFLCETD